MTEKTAEKITKLKQELRTLEEQIESCRHEFSEPREVQLEYYEQVYSHMGGQGSDPWPVYNSVKHYMTGWERECDKCGYKERTNKREPIISGYKPVFDKK